MAAPKLHPQIEQAFNKVDAFIAKYPTLTQHGKQRQVHCQSLILSWLVVGLLRASDGPTNRLGMKRV